MTNYGQPAAWIASASVTVNQSEVSASVGHTGFYYVCTQTGTSGSVPPTWASVFGATVTDGTATWVCAQRQRSAWVSKSQYTDGNPFQTTATFTAGSASITVIAGGAKFIPIGCYFVANQGTAQAAPPSYGNTIIAVTAASTVVMSSAASLASSDAGLPVVFSQIAPYPLPDQIITGGAGSPVVQCIQTGTSGSVQPTWPNTIGASVSDGSIVWSTVGTN